MIHILLTSPNQGSFSIIPTKEKLTNKELIVIVQSRPTAIADRQSCRDTWGRNGNIKEVIFYLDKLKIICIMLQFTKANV